VTRHGRRLNTVCGRYASSRTSTDLADFYGATVKGADLGAQYNVAPTTSIYAVVDRQDRETGAIERQLHDVRWGLVPSWARDTKIGNKLINARVETIAEKPSWRTAYRRRRAVIPADGYYEWVAETDDAGMTIKQPYYLHPAAGSGLSFAGLYEWRPDPEKDKEGAGCGRPRSSPVRPPDPPAKSTTAPRSSCRQTGSTPGSTRPIRTRPRSPRSSTASALRSSAFARSRARSTRSAPMAPS
jgi:hypothetical protein